MTTQSIQSAGPPMGSWFPAENNDTEHRTIAEAMRLITHPLYLVIENGSLVARSRGGITLGDAPPAEGGLPLVGYAPPGRIENLGNAGFCQDNGIRYPYLGGSMARGISSTAMVEALGRAGMLGFFGSAGLSIDAVEAAIDRLSQTPDSFPFGINLIHSPGQPDLEAALVDLYLRKGIHLVEASAFMTLTLPVIRYRVAGIHRGPDGDIITPNRIIAKVSREEIATKFFSPPPEKFLRELVNSQEITPEQAELASRIPVAQDVTAEADSGGHTDKRPALTLFPTICAARDRMQQKFGFHVPLRVGLGGGIGSPISAASAFTMGAAYIMTGSVNQACTESGTSDQVRDMLAATRQADVTMAPAADMFEMGVTVQVLKRGTMFAMRAAKLFKLYRAHTSIDDLPPTDRQQLETTLFKAPLEDIWEQTRSFFLQRDPRQVERAERDEKHRLALVFRWYLGQSPRWASIGESSRRVDYQIWCGPAMGAFNEWVKGTFLETPANRQVVPVALNILLGASVILRLNQLRLQGANVGSPAPWVMPIESNAIKEYLT